MLNFISSYAPWCPACRAMEDTWDKVAGWGEDLDFSVGKIDVTENPGIIHVFFYSLIVIFASIRMASASSPVFKIFFEKM